VFKQIQCRCYSFTVMLLGAVGSRGLGPPAQKSKSRVVAPRNPKLLKGEQLHSKVKHYIQHLNNFYRHGTFEVTKYCHISNLNVIYSSVPVCCNDDCNNFARFIN